MYSHNRLLVSRLPLPITGLLFIAILISLCRASATHIIIISGFGIYGAAVVPDSGVGNTWQRLTLFLHEFLSNGLTPSRLHIVISFLTHVDHVFLGLPRSLVPGSPNRVMELMPVPPKTPSAKNSRDVWHRDVWTCMTVIKEAWHSATRCYSCLRLINRCRCALSQSAAVTALTVSSSWGRNILIHKTLWTHYTTT